MDKDSNAPLPSWPGGRAPTEQERVEIDAWFDATEMCGHCCHRVPKSEVEAGLHKHPAVMD